MPGLLKPDEDLGQIRKRYQDDDSPQMKIPLVKQFLLASLHDISKYIPVKYLWKVLSIDFNFS